MSPFAASRIIPTGWSQHHARHMPTAMNATVTILDPTSSTHPGPVDPDTGERPPATPTVVRGDVPARVVMRGVDGATATQGADQVPYREYVVQLPQDVTVDVETHEIRVDTIRDRPDDTLIGRTLYPVHAAEGSERFVRDLICTLTPTPRQR